MGQTRDNMVEEARRIADEAQASGAPVRLVGGLAIRLHDDRLPPSLVRTYADIDLATTSKGAKPTDALMASLGYAPNDRFNAMNAGRRMVFYDVERGRQIDVFIGEFRMCHRIDLTGRIDVEPRTVPLAELLLTKLQIVQLNHKDLVDIAAILHGHDVGATDDDTVNADVIARTLSADWGFWRTTRGSIETARGRLAEVGVDADDVARIDDRLGRLWDRIEAEPKSLRWRSRAKIGDRARWYEEPEEIDHDRTGGQR